MTQRDPSIRVAFSQAAKGVLHRPARQLAAALGVVLAIALFAYVRTSQMLASAHAAEPDAIEAANRIRWLTALSLLICFTGIMNAMLMSVTERFREIGTMKCLGATNGFVLKLFFVEAAMIGISASLAGGLLGVLAAALMHAASDGIGAFGAAALAAPSVFGASCLLGTGLTVIAALAPALQAAKMPPVAALRVEI